MIDFQDACRSSTITAKTVTFASVKFDMTGTQFLTPFVDSIDAGGSYTKGICGEKTITLEVSTPSFLTLTADTIDPINADLNIAYDATLAFAADIKSHTIAYTVSSKEYPTLVPDITGTFTFEILCPDQAIT